MAGKLTIQTTFLLDERREKSNGLYPIKFRITYKRVQSYFSLKRLEPIIQKLNLESPGTINKLLKTQDFSSDDWQRITGEKPRGDFKELAMELSKIENRINHIISELPEFSIELLERKITDVSDKNNVFSVYEERIQKYYEAGQAGTASNYQCSLNSLKNFTGKDYLRFTEIDSQFLEKYEADMIKQGKSISTIGIYLRPLRSVFNSSDIKNYPFSRKKKDGGYIIPGGRNIKKSLNDEQLRKLFDYSPENRYEQRAIDYFKFSFLAKGMNLTDIANLRYLDFTADDRFTFIRQKTARTTKDKQTKIEIILNDMAKEIILRQGNPDNNSGFVFPIISKDHSAKERRLKINILNSNINHNLKTIAKKIGITGNLSFYFGRHSFATRLMRSGISIEYISKSLGHSDIKTTANYLGSFEESQEMDILNILTNF